MAILLVTLLVQRVSRTKLAVFTVFEAYVDGSVGSLRLLLQYAQFMRILGEGTYT